MLVGTLIWLTVVKEKTVSPPLHAKGMMSVIAPGHDQRRDLSATIDHSDIRGFYRMTCLHRGAVSLYRRKFGEALFPRVNESSPDRGRVSGDALDSCI